MVISDIIAFGKEIPAELAADFDAERISHVISSGDIKRTSFLPSI